MICLYLVLFNIQINLEHQASVDTECFFSLREALDVRFSQFTDDTAGENDTDDLERRTDNLSL